MMSLKIIQDENSYRSAFGRENYYLLIMGESGFECYLSCPVSQIKAGLDAISLLMLDLEALSWHGRLYDGKLDDVSTSGYEADIECGEFQVGDRLERGEITMSLWLSPVFSKYSIYEQVFDILRGSSLRIIWEMGSGCK